MAKVRFRVDFAPGCSVGPGKIELLEAIRAGGSLSQAARDLGMSYRRAWLLLDSLNKSFDQPVTTATVGGRGGGGVTLTPFARELVRRYRLFETAVQSAAVRGFRGITESAQSAGGLTANHSRPRTSGRARKAP